MPTSYRFDVAVEIFHVPISSWRQFTRGLFKRRFQQLLYLLHEPVLRKIMAVCLQMVETKACYMHVSAMIVESSWFPVAQLVDDIRNADELIAYQVAITNAHAVYTRDVQFLAYFGHDPNMHEH